MCKTIKQKVTFKAPPKDIYDFLVDSKKHKIGGRFTADSGYARGLIVDLVPGKRLVQAWRGKDFPQGIFSMATFNLKPTKSGTELILTHRGVPKELIPAIERKWRENYWAKIKLYIQYTTSRNYTAANA
jgi:activator of HSP90 ATPase